MSVVPTSSSNVIEKAVHLQLYTSLKKNNLLAIKQFGFHPNLSTEVALAHLTENILDNMDNGFITGAVFLNLSKAFDTVHNQILLKKLHCLGLNNNSWSGLNPISLIVNRSPQSETVSRL